MSRPEWFKHFFDASYVAALREEKPFRQTRLEVEFVLRSVRPPEDARILDLPCGYGRHAALLARRGFRVVGVDLSPAMLAEARRRFTEGPRLRFRRGDMRRIAFREEFDAVINLYTSFGYFTPAQNVTALRRMARALRPGGRLLVDHRDPAYDADLPRRLWYRTGRKRFVLGGSRRRPCAFRSSPFPSGGGCSGRSACSSSGPTPATMGGRTARARRAVSSCWPRNEDRARFVTAPP